MTKIEKFIEANPTDKRVIALVKLMNSDTVFNSLHTASRMGRLMGELMREADLVVA